MILSDVNGLTEQIKKYFEKKSGALVSVSRVDSMTRSFYRASFDFELLDSSEKAFFDKINGICEAIMELEKSKEALSALASLKQILKS